MASPVGNYRHLDSDKIIETVRTLQARIDRRFPGCGLASLATDLLKIAEETVVRSRWIREPHWLLRCVAILLSVAIIILFVVAIAHIPRYRFEEYTDFIQALEASISSVVFIGAAVLFFVSWEIRIKRNRALKALHELRAMAHIVDMHQLPKHPESCFAPQRNPTPQMRRAMSPYELNRYLDYCSDTLALISKIAALYVQDFQDTVLLDAVDDVEDLTAGLSRKIWQKITILESLGRVIPASENETTLIAKPPVTEASGSD